MEKIELPVYNLKEQSCTIQKIHEDFKNFKNSFWFDTDLFENELPLRCPQTTCFRCLQQFLIEKQIIHLFKSKFVKHYPTTNYDLHIFLVCIYLAGLSNDLKARFHFQKLALFIRNRDRYDTNLELDEEIKVTYKTLVLILWIKFQALSKKKVNKLKCLASLRIIDLIKGKYGKSYMSFLDRFLDVKKTVEKICFHSNLNAHKIGHLSIKHCLTVQSWFYSKSKKFINMGIKLHSTTIFTFTTF